MMFNQYEKIRRIYTEEDYIGSKTEALVSHECSRFLSSRPKAFSRRKIKARALYYTLLSLQTMEKTGKRRMNCTLAGKERVH